MMRGIVMLIDAHIIDASLMHQNEAIQIIMHQNESIPKGLYGCTVCT
jgi:hypothetical protein